MRLLWIKSTWGGNPERGRLERQRFQLSVAGTTVEASELLNRQKFDVILCCLPFAEPNSSEMQRLLSAVSRESTVVFYDPQDVYSKTDLSDLRLRSCKVIPAVETEHLPGILRDLAQPRLETRAKAGWRKSLVGESDAIERIAETVELIAPRRATVLITGETGTGKDVVARAIHQASPRAAMPMVSVNCGAIPESLIESELFGHVKGSFTGAFANRPGHFVEADGGSLFLDEIAETPIGMQPKLLRAIQEREIRPVGGSEPSAVDIRLITATNQDLRRAIRQKTFREDLYFRINVVSLHLPPLRERLTDVPSLTDHFIEKICSREDLPMKTIGADVIERLSSYAWPGNVRELEHCIEKSVTMSGEKRSLTADDIALPEVNPALPGMAYGFDLPQDGLDFEQFIDDVQRMLMIQALQRTSGNKARAAQMLRLKRSTLLSKVKSLSAVCA